MTEQENSVQLKVRSFKLIVKENLLQNGFVENKNY